MVGTIGKVADPEGREVHRSTGGTAAAAAAGGLFQVVGGGGDSKYSFFFARILFQMNG